MASKKLRRFTKHLGRIASEYKQYEIAITDLAQHLSRITLPKVGRVMVSGAQLATIGRPKIYEIPERIRKVHRYLERSTSMHLDKMDEIHLRQLSRTVKKASEKTLQQEKKADELDALLAEKHKETRITNLHRSITLLESAMKQIQGNSARKNEIRLKIGDLRERLRGLEA